MPLISPYSHDRPEASATTFLPENGLGSHAATPSGSSPAPLPRAGYARGIHESRRINERDKMNKKAMVSCHVDR